MSDMAVENENKRQRSYQRIQIENLYRISQNLPKF